MKMVPVLKAKRLTCASLLAAAWMALMPLSAHAQLQEVTYLLPAPANLPAPILRRIHGDMVKAITAPEASRKYVEAGAIVTVSATPEDFAARLKREVDSVGRIVKRAGIQPVE